MFEDRTLESYNYRPTEWVQASNIVVQGEKLGSIEISYREPVPSPDTNPFLIEERKLLDTIAEQIATEVRQRRFDALTEADDNQAGDDHWRWRYRMAEQIVGYYRRPG